MTERQPSPLTPGAPAAVPTTAVSPAEKAPGEPLGLPPPRDARRAWLPRPHPQ
ncbi:hypothetical protein C8250_029430 [Streptomyces sp. So13.3]|uniref:hypothetical protein n=1 Tax=Streptomyces sp. So13.3 TaxID=2136173 RepID=UPI00164D7525|nr:hypothetical protein [Streptomyces sp. So13.3]QNA75461.1 hypothetical protein C8250_029430 [Streptomyces sp. So13.3]